MILRELLSTDEMYSRIIFIKVIRHCFDSVFNSS